MKTAIASTLTIRSTTAIIVIMTSRFLYHLSNSGSNNETATAMIVMVKVRVDDFFAGKCNATFANMIVGKRSAHGVALPLASSELRSAYVSLFANLRRNPTPLHLKKFVDVFAEKRK